MAKYILSTLMAGKPEAAEANPQTELNAACTCKSFSAVSGCISEWSGVDWIEDEGTGHTNSSCSQSWAIWAHSLEARVVPSTINNLPLAQSVVYAGGDVSLKYANYQDLNAVIKNKQNDFMDSKMYENRALKTAERKPTLNWAEPK